METKQASLTETLTEERVRRVGEMIAGLPTGDEFRQAVEDDLWREFTGMDKPPEESIEWEELPEVSKSIFGYVDEEEETVPWWLESFKWEAHTYAGTSVDIGDSLSKFGKAPVKEISSPILQESGIIQSLNSFKELWQSIDEHSEWRLEGEESDYTLPTDDTGLFEISINRMETTDEFSRWIEEKFPSLSPPFNEELTALLMVNSNVKRDFIEEVAPDRLVQTLENVGLSGERIFNEDYHSQLVDILDKMGGIFHVSLPDLELLFYKRWVENYNGEMDNWIEMAITTAEIKADKPSGGDIDPVEEERFAQVAFTLPLRVGTNSNTLIYTTCKVGENGYYKSGFKEIEGVMESATKDG